ncbi:CoA pyrophosphatase [Clostridium sp. SYSU_GA19001]|uniref:NUDIX hydrolase n=1 Tax=Clostridium caldaquaticum TaxID=2940653 RepID=UPI00207768E0|nr:CoA pyrophosphatase [Clostridium caldaquaticum]MCM8711321.1 CoA pyrophosphatase [Clostridium caldaquaticum]
MIDVINNIFKERKAGLIGDYRRNAVMILLCEENDETYIIFEERSLTLRHQPGDICLPGGKLEEGERPEETALRETLEELGLNKEDIVLIGEMDYFISPYGSIIYPFIGKLNGKKLNPNPSEVHQIFKVPLSYFLEKEPVEYEMEIGPNLKEDFPYHLVNGGKNYKFSRGKLNQYFYKYDKYIIWGFTAIIIKSFIDIIKKEAIK